MTPVTQQVPLTCYVREFMSLPPMALARVERLLARGGRTNAEKVRRILRRYR